MKINNGSVFANKLIMICAKLINEHLAKRNLVARMRGAAFVIATNTLSKEELAAETAEIKQAIEEVVDTFLETLISEVEQGNQVRVFELGTFSLQTRSARTGRNPATGESVAIPEKRVPKLVFNQAIAKRISK